MDEIMTTCDRCGDKLPAEDANYIGREWPYWEGARLCPDCWAELSFEEQEKQRC